MHSLENTNVHSCFLLLLPPNQPFLPVSVSCGKKDDILKFGNWGTSIKAGYRKRIGHSVYSGVSNSRVLFPPLHLEESWKGVVTRTVWWRWLSGEGSCVKEVSLQLGDSATAFLCLIQPPYFTYQFAQSYTSSYKNQDWKPGHQICTLVFLLLHIISSYFYDQETL